MKQIEIDPQARYRLKDAGEIIGKTKQQMNYYVNYWAGIPDEDILTSSGKRIQAGQAKSIKGSALIKIANTFGIGRK